MVEYRADRLGNRYETWKKRKKKKKGGEEKQSRALFQRREKTESRIFGIYFWQDRVFDSGNTQHLAQAIPEAGPSSSKFIIHPPLSWSDLNRAHRMDTCFLYSKLVPHGDTMNFTALGKLRKPSQPLSLSLSNTRMDRCPRSRLIGQRVIDLVQLTNIRQHIYIHHR